MVDQLKSILSEFWYEKLKDVIISNSDWKTYLSEDRELTFPKLENTFVAINNVSPSDAKVIIFGQDPYPREESAIGYAFWDGKVENWNNPLSPSIRNIFKSVLLHNGYGEPKMKIKEVRKIVKDNNILQPAPFFKNSIDQGVVWLNASLTFTSKDTKQLARHLKFWKPIIKKIIEVFLAESDSLVFVFWGGKAKVFQKVINKIDAKAKYKFVENCHPMLDTFPKVNSFDDIKKAQEELGQDIIKWL